MAPRARLVLVGGIDDRVAARAREKVGQIGLVGLVLDQVIDHVEREREVRPDEVREIDRGGGVVPEERLAGVLREGPAAKLDAEREKRQSEIESKLQALSDEERSLLENMCRCDGGNLAALARFALTLVVGKPVAPFAEALSHWCFAMALNAPRGAPFAEFSHLLQLNRVDWSPTRRAILRA